jgi:hypothetical protein
MPFLGYTPDNTFHTLSKQTIAGDGGTSYTLTNPVVGSNDIEVFVNNVRQDQPYDKRFYYSAGVPRALEDVASVDENGDPVLDENGNQIIQKGLKSQWIEKTKETAHSLLTPTDWYELRKLTKAIDIPANVIAYRDAVVQASETIEAAINSSTTMQEFMALFETVDGTNPPIHNWPEGL